MNIIKFQYNKLNKINTQKSLAVLYMINEESEELQKESHSPLQQKE